MSLEPWREVAVPHADVLKGTMKQANFAANISDVHAGNAPPEYQDAPAFFVRTYEPLGRRCQPKPSGRATCRGAIPLCEGAVTPPRRAVTLRPAP